MCRVRWGVPTLWTCRRKGACQKAQWLRLCTAYKMSPGSSRASRLTACTISKTVLGQQVQQTTYAPCMPAAPHTR